MTENLSADAERLASTFEKINRTLTQMNRSLKDFGTNLKRANGVGGSGGTGGTGSANGVDLGTDNAIFSAGGGMLQKLGTTGKVVAAVAGGIQTASAIMGDLVSAAKRHVAGGPGLADSVHADLEVLPISRVNTRYQITLEVSDQPGVLAQIANVFAKHQVSIETVEQSAKMIEAETVAWLEIGTHQASDKDLAAVVAELANSESVERITSVIRVEGE